jgi:hypothetical protein
MLRERRSSLAGAVLAIGSGRRRTAGTHEEFLTLKRIRSCVMSAARADCLTLSHYPLFSGYSATFCSLYEWREPTPPLNLDLDSCTEHFCSLVVEITDGCVDVVVGFIVAF